MRKSYPSQMPDFKTEKELQQHLVRRLKERGHSVQQEVPVSSRQDRIDILTEGEIIECKKTLTRSTGYQALLQKWGASARAVNLKTSVIKSIQPYVIF